MRDSARIRDALELVGQVWRQYPDLRLGQLLVNATGERELFYVEDTELIERLREVAKTGFRDVG